MSLDALRLHLQQRGLDVAVIDTNPREHGRLAATLRALASLCVRLASTDVVTLHFSDRATVTAAPLFWLLSRLAGRPVIFRQFGGEFDRTFAALPAWRRSLLQRTVLRSHAVLLQTRSLLAAFAPVAPRLHWFPTARPRPTQHYEAAFARGAQGTLRCAFIAHVRQAKGVLTAARAVAAVPGTSLDIYGPLIDVDVTELHLPRVSYRGVLDASQVPAAMAGYDLLLFPTTYPGEGYPGTLVEAALVGLPIVASRWQSLPEMFNDDEVEFVEPGSVDALATVIRHVVTHPAWLLERSAKLRARAEATFDAAQVFNRFVEVCMSAVPSPVQDRG